MNWCINKAKYPPRCGGGRVLDRALLSILGLTGMYGRQSGGFEAAGAWSQPVCQNVTVPTYALTRVQIWRQDKRLTIESRPFLRNKIWTCHKSGCSYFGVSSYVGVQLPVQT